MEFSLFFKMITRGRKFSFLIRVLIGRMNKKIHYLQIPTNWTISCYVEFMTRIYGRTHIFLNYFYHLHVLRLYMCSES